MAPTDDIDALYAALKRLTPRVRHDRALTCPPALSTTVSSPECGSRIELDALIENGQVQDIGYRVRACSLGQAATAILIDHVPGLTLAELQGVRRQLEALLRDGQGHCDWPELEVFAPACDIPNRHASVLLPFRGLEQLFALARARP